MVICHALAVPVVDFVKQAVNDVSLILLPANRRLLDEQNT